MDWSVAARFLGALIDLVMLEKQLDILEMTKDAAYELADRQLLLAEEIVVVHQGLLALTAGYYGTANSAPTYGPNHSCAMDVANTNVKRESNRYMNNILGTLDMYNSGRRRDVVETAMAAIVRGSSSEWAKAYRNEDDLQSFSQLNRYKALADSVNSASLFTGHATMSRLASDTVQLANTASDLASNHFNSFVTGVTDWIAGPSSDRGSDTVAKTSTQALNNMGDVATPLPESRVLTAEPLNQTRTGDTITRLPESRTLRAEPLNPNNGDNANGT